MRCVKTFLSLEINGKSKRVLNVEIRDYLIADMRDLKIAAPFSQNSHASKTLHETDQAE